MALRIGVLMDPIATINTKKDTTLGLLRAASAAGHQLTYLEQADLTVKNGETMASLRSLTVYDDDTAWYAMGERYDASLSTLDVVLMRKDPPFDMEFFYTTQLLEDAERRGTLIVNRCASLRDCNEKLFATQFPECCPPLLVSRDPTALKAFHAEHGDVIFKPLDGMGGQSIFRVKENDPNLNVILETLTDNGGVTIMAQQYLPAIKDGDKRVLMINGEAVPFCLARLPMAGENRGNLAAGGSGIVQPLSDRDRWIAEQVGPTLREKGLLFVGLDIIGDYLTEINVTSPTCMREIDRAKNTQIAEQLIACIEREVSESRGR
ncbi:MAG: glutathione synthase [Pseudomonadota bacterium]|nr:glutathione synthase [Pseudomonadota bacterium]MEE3095420.1 glutathione synthase [Pseudomonadota bacterium]